MLVKDDPDAPNSDEESSAPGPIYCDLSFSETSLLIDHKKLGPKATSPRFHSADSPRAPPQGFVPSNQARPRTPPPLPSRSPPPARTIPFTCWKCGGTGHMSASCATPNYCNRCKKAGHTDFSCRYKPAPALVNNSSQKLPAVSKTESSPGTPSNLNS